MKDERYSLLAQLETEEDLTIDKIMEMEDRIKEIQLRLRREAHRLAAKVDEFCGPIGWGNNSSDAWAA